ncbi:unnamed protein product [Closterium sp. Naga37s-1]|nr:unnamed protein product [Closterium sp. Naga37s-1]
MGPSRVRPLPAIHRLLGTPRAPGGRGTTQCMIGRVLGMPQGARCSAQPPSTRACPSVPLSSHLRRLSLTLLHMPSPPLRFPPAPSMCSPRASHVFLPRVCAPQVPRERKIANVQSLGFGALFAPTPPLPASAASPLLSPSASTLSSPTSAAPASSQPPPVVRHAPLRCAFCGACVCLYSAIAPATGDWRCALCGRPNMSGGHYLLAEGETLEGWPELGARVVDYVEAGGGARGAGGGGSGGERVGGGAGGAGGGGGGRGAGRRVHGGRQSRAHGECMAGVRAALTLTVRADNNPSSLHPRPPLVPPSSPPRPPSSPPHFFLPHASPALTPLRPMAGHAAAPAIRHAHRHHHLRRGPLALRPLALRLAAARLRRLLPRHARAAPRHAGRAACWGARSTSRPSRPACPPRRPFIASLRPCRAATPPLARARALGPAVELALALLRGPAPALPRAEQRAVERGGARGGAVRGASHSGRGGGGGRHRGRGGRARSGKREQAARRHYEALGREARRMGAVVDVFSGGPLLVRMPALLPLAALSGGALVPLDEFSPAAFPPLLLRALSRIVGAEGSLEVCCSPEVAVTRVIGPAEAEEGGGRRGAGGEEGFPEDSATAVALLSVDEEAAVAVSMELVEDLTRHHVFFQFLCRFRLLNHDLRLPVAASLPAYLSSVHEATAALLIAKRTVLAAPTAREAGEMRAWVDARARDLALKLGGVAQHNRSLLQFPHQLPRWGGKERSEEARGWYLVAGPVGEQCMSAAAPTLAIPPPISPPPLPPPIQPPPCRVAEALYEVRRSPVLGRHVAGEWERQALRALLLRAGGEAALRMVLPSLLMFRAGHATQFVEVPPSDLALTSDAALVLDHGTDMLIWLGAHLAPDEPTRRGVEAACRQLAAQLMGGPGGRGRFPAPRVLCFTVSAKGGERVRRGCWEVIYLCVCAPPCALPCAPPCTPSVLDLQPRILALHSPLAPPCARPPHDGMAGGARRKRPS